jgi:acyl-CoA hydrolase
MRCATVVAEVDENVPFTFGNQFPVDRITHFVASTRPMPLYELGESNDVSRRIANNVMPLIANGATLQIGIGALPEAITSALLESGHRNLRFVGMGSDIMADFAARGMLTTDDVITALFSVELMGTRIVMDFAHRNPMVNVVSSLRGHNVTLLSSLPNFISINSAIEVDLTGQINAESVGTQQISGVGGSVDYVETAYQSRGGHRVTVIQSTAKGGAKSSIVPRLGEGTTTSIPRSMADIIVTEHGVADLRGKSTRERAEAMVAIADPLFRDELAQHIASSATRQSQ